jgi:hypothetical protein
MGFLRRLLGGGETPGDEGEAASIDPAELDAAEREHELEMLRADQERLDELTQRQLRYAKYAWEPPAQGGEKRAEDNDSTGSGG